MLLDCTREDLLLPNRVGTVSLLVYGLVYCVPDGQLDLDTLMPDVNDDAYHAIPLFRFFRKNF